MNKTQAEAELIAKMAQQREEQYGSLSEVEVVFTPEGIDNEIYLK